MSAKRDGEMARAKMAFFDKLVAYVEQQREANAWGASKSFREAALNSLDEIADEAWEIAFNAGALSERAS